MKTTSTAKSGFTLIELVIVIAILAFVAVVGIHSYGNIREIQAKKMNMANIKRIYHALSTYETINKEQGAIGYFNYFDALVDAERSSGAWTGSPGTMKWTDLAVSGQPGIYDGSWKVLDIPLSNAAGVGSKTYTLEEAQTSNKGTRETGLLNTLAIYYLSTNDCALLKNAGIDIYLLHNPSTAQSSTFAALPTGVKSPGGGGPGFRPDNSAYFPADLKPGSPVALVKPLVSGKGGASISTVYSDLGYFNSDTNTWTTQAADQEKMLSSLGVRLVAFGIGKCAECVRSQFGLGESPVNPYYDKTHYRSYIAIFALKDGGQGVVSSCRLAGVIDCSGNTYKQAEYGVNWTTQLGN